MRASDIVTTLKGSIPRFTDLFSTILEVGSLTQVAGIATAITATPHGRKDGDVVTVLGSLVPNAIASLSQVDGIGTAVTGTSHDLSEGEQETVTISGATEASYNGTFPLLGVQSRTTFTFKIDDGAPATASGAPILEEDLDFGYNGFFTVTVVDETTFTYPVSAALISPAAGTIAIHANTRISRASNSQRAFAAYTEQTDQTDLWMYVVLGPRRSNKSRESNTDSIKDTRDTDDPRQLFISTFSLIVFSPMRDSVSAAEPRDGMQEVYGALLRSLLGLSFDEDLPSGDEHNVAFVDDDEERTEGEVSAYVHRFTFEQVTWLDRCDVADETRTVAWRDSFIDLRAQGSEQAVTVNVKMDQT